MPETDFLSKNKLSFNAFTLNKCLIMKLKKKSLNICSQLTVGEFNVHALFEEKGQTEFMCVSH